MKKAEGQPEGAEVAGWGVEEADARNKKEASTSFQPPLLKNNPRMILTKGDRSSNTTSSRLRNTQILHLHPRPAYHLHYAESRACPARLGLGYREADDEGGEGY